MKKQYLECGKIVSMHGVHGEVRILPWCDGPDYLLDFERLYLEKGARELKVLRARTHKNLVIAKFEGFDTLEQATELRGRVVYINREDDPAGEDGMFFVQDLIGLNVLDADTGYLYGSLSDVFVTGANDVYEITSADGGKHLIPAIRDVVLHTDPDAGVMHIRPLKGLFGDED